MFALHSPSSGIRFHSLAKILRFKAESEGSASSRSRPGSRVWLGRDLSYLMRDPAQAPVRWVLVARRGDAQSRRR